MPSWILRWTLGLAVLLLIGCPSTARAEVRWRIQIGRGGFPEPVWVGRDLHVLVKRWEKAREALLKKMEAEGQMLSPPPSSAFPAWSRCQELARDRRGDMLLVRMNLAALKAARRLMKGRLNDRGEDSLQEGFPFSFSPRDWGEEILRDFRLMGRSKEQVFRILGQEEDYVRQLLIEVRDGINRDVVWEHHQWERAKRTGEEKAIRRCAWRLWVVLGGPDGK